ncbi:MAG: hypothetical protein LBP28_02705 [Coriobacteriales bacterium]|jgi:hypothetical protein|nr:hypothetical protein [Coriobacteriales bacterium]
MKRMTEAQAASLDRELTDIAPRLGDERDGFLTRNREFDLLAGLDKLSAGYIRSQSESSHMTPTEVIGALVRKEMASAS